MKAAPIIALMGLTATGKTRLAIELAHALDCDVISVDSVMIYRGLDIGSAKPTEAERGGIKHHLIDLVDPNQVYSAAQFVNDALVKIRSNQAQGKPSLLVGGSMLYFSALLHGLSDLPATPPELKAKLNQVADEQGSNSLHAYLAKIDEVSAERLHPNDLQRVVRAIAVWEMTGRPLSEHQGNKQRIFDEYTALAMVPEDRTAHRACLKERFLHMLDNGFEQEMQTLFKHPQLTRNHPSMSSVGYHQWWSYLEGHSSRQEAIERSVNATSQLAKRQRTWLNRFPECHIISSEQATPAKLKHHLKSFLN